MRCFQRTERDTFDEFLDLFLFFWFAILSRFFFLSRSYSLFAAHMTASCTSPSPTTPPISPLRMLRSVSPASNRSIGVRAVPKRGRGGNVGVNNGGNSTLHHWCPHNRSCVGLFRFTHRGQDPRKPVEWVYVGRNRSHRAPITDVQFGVALDGRTPRLMSVCVCVCEGRRSLFTFEGL